MRWQPILARCFALGTGMVSVTASAGPLLISPTTVEFAAGKRNAVIEVTNLGEAPADLQFRAFDWAQPSGEDQLSPTDNLIVSPPLVSLPPHGKQVFRILSVAPDQSSVERSYRLKLNELPRYTAGQIAINVEFLIPVFMTPPGVQPRVVGTVEAAGRAVSLNNVGARRIRIIALKLASGGRETPIPLHSAVYILSGARHQFAMPTGVAARVGDHLDGSADTGPIDVPLAAAETR